MIQYRALQASTAFLIALACTAFQNIYSDNHILDTRKTDMLRMRMKEKEKLQQRRKSQDKKDKAAKNSKSSTNKLLGGAKKKTK